MYVYIYMAVDQNTVLSRPPHTPPHPTPPHLCFRIICHGLSLQTFVANAWCRYALQKNLVAKVLVASQGILLQTYVAEWPPEPVTNPVFLIHSHIHIYIYIYIYIYTCTWIGLYGVNTWIMGKKMETTTSE